MIQLTDKQTEQLKNFATCFVEYPAISKIFQDFDLLRLNKKLNREPESLLLIGESGSGKTALINQYLSQLPKAEKWGKSPILSTRVPSKVNEQDVLVQFLKDLAGNTYGRTVKSRNNIALAAGVVRELKQKETELIIVNEVQELIEYATSKEKQAIANAFKYISEEARVSFILVGMPYASLIAEEPQWNSRLSRRRELSYFKLFKHSMSPKAQFEIDIEQKKHFAMFIAGLCKRMGYEQAPKLTSDDILYPLFAMSRGECRKIKHFLNDAMLISFQQNKEMLDREDLTIAFAQKFPSEANPFEDDLAYITFNQIKENSRYNANALASQDKILPPKFTDKISLSLLLSKNSSLLTKA